VEPSNDTRAPTAGKPGSSGEHALQQRYGTTQRASAFYDHQVLDRLSDEMQAFIPRQRLMFVATADSHGECDCSIRAGVPGQFVAVLDERTLAYPEYRGNGVMASLGNIAENGYVGLLFVDFFESTVGLHVNGHATIVEHDSPTTRPDNPPATPGLNGRTPERWVRVSVVEAYIHCSKHIPLLQLLDKEIHWGTDVASRKGGDYFHVKHLARPWRQSRPQTPPARTVELPVTVSIDTLPRK
jgi:predicted pyridoxine 5'-phosphate oxidase superfamily flavin-nucleotide-binding protein